MKRSVIFVLLLVSVCRSQTVYEDTIWWDELEMCAFSEEDQGGHLTTPQVCASTSSKLFTAVRIKDVRESIPKGARIKSFELYMKGSPETDTGWFEVYPFRVNWNNSDLTGDRTGGATYVSRWAPEFCTDTVGQENLPVTFSWTDSGMVTAPKNQSSCGACWIFGAAGAIEATHMIQKLVPRTLWDTADGSGHDLDHFITMDTIVNAGQYYYWYLDPYKVFRWGDQTEAETGVIVRRVSGSGSFRSSDGTESYRPQIAINAVSVNGNEVTFTYDGTDLVDTYVGSGSDSTTDRSAADTVALNSTHPFMLVRPVGVSSDFGDSILYVQSASLKYRTKAVSEEELVVQVHHSMRKFVASEAGYYRWKSGYEWATAGALKYRDIDVSEQQILSCGIPREDGCTGGDPSQVFDYFLDEPLADEVDAPYKGDTLASRCPSSFSALDTLRYWRYVDSPNGSSIRDTADDNWFKQIVLMRPVVVAINVWAVNDSFGSCGTLFNYEGGCYWHPLDTGVSNPGGNSHSVLVVGWNDTLTCGSVQTGAWRVKNSWWWTEWGEGGYAWIRFGDIVPAGYVVTTAEADSSKKWATAGALSTTEDIYPKYLVLDQGDTFAIRVSRYALGSILEQEGWSVTEFTDSGLIKTVQPIVDGTMPNYGWKLAGVTTNASMSFVSLNDESEGDRPYMVYTYTLPVTAFGRTSSKPLTIGRTGSKPAVVGR